MWEVDGGTMPHDGQSLDRTGTAAISVQDLSERTGATQGAWLLQAGYLFALRRDEPAVCRLRTSMAGRRHRSGPPNGAARTTLDAKVPVPRCLRYVSGPARPSTAFSHRRHKSPCVGELLGQTRRWFVVHLPQRSQGPASSQSRHHARTTLAQALSSRLAPGGRNSCTRNASIQTPRNVNSMTGPVRKAGKPRPSTHHWTTAAASSAGTHQTATMPPFMAKANRHTARSFRARLHLFGHRLRNASADFRACVSSSGVVNSKGCLQVTGPARASAFGTDAEAASTGRSRPAIRSANACAKRVDTSSSVRFQPALRSSVPGSQPSNRRIATTAPTIAPAYKSVWHGELSARSELVARAAWRLRRAAPRASHARRGEDGIRQHVGLGTLDAGRSTDGRWQVNRTSDAWSPLARPQRCRGCWVAHEHGPADRPSARHRCPPESIS